MCLVCVIRSGSSLEMDFDLLGPIRKGNEGEEAAFFSIPAVYMRIECVSLEAQELWNCPYSV